MSFNIFLSSTVKRLRAISGLSVVVAMWIAGLTATANALKVSYIRGYLACNNSDQYLNCIGIYDRHGSYLEWLNFQQLKITVLLYIFVIGLLLWRNWGFLLSLAALIWIGKIYLWWRLSTLAFLRMAEIPNYSLLEGLKRQQLDFLLRDATWWDMAVLTVCFLLLVWQVKLLLTVVRSTQ